MSERETLSQLLREARAERPQALARLLESYRAYLKFLACASLGDDLRGKADASDVVQEALWRAHERFPQFRGVTEAELAAWLRQILTHQLVDLARRFRRTEAGQVQRERPLHEVVDASAARLSGLLAAPGPSPSQSAQRSEMGVVLAAALAALPDDYRTVLVLRSLDERGWDEVARLMGRSKGAVRMLWVRALQSLKPLIEERL